MLLMNHGQHRESLNIERKQVGRQVEFDEREVLNKAMQVFWRTGYHAAGMQELQQAMALHRGSIYSTFHSKRELFLRVLDLYAEQFDKVRDMIFSAVDPLQGLRDLFDFVVESCLEDRQGYSCLYVNTILELASVDRGIVDYVREKMQELEGIFYEALRQAQLQQKIGPQHDPRQLAVLLINLLCGLRVTSQMRPGRWVLQACVDNTFNAFVPPAGG